MPQTIKLVDAGRKLRLKKMQIAGYKAKAARDGRVLVGFYKDKDGKTKPITRSIREINRKKVAKHSKQFRGVKPRSMHVDEESQEYVQSLPLQKLTASARANKNLAQLAKITLPKRFVRYMKLKSPKRDAEVAEWVQNYDNYTRAVIEKYHPDADVRAFFQGMNRAAGIRDPEYELAHEEAVKGYAKVLMEKAKGPKSTGTVWEIRRVFFSKGAHVVTAHPLASFKIRTSKDIKKANLAFKELVGEEKDDRSTERVFMQDNHGSIIQNRRFPRKRYSPPLSEVAKPFYWVPNAKKLDVKTVHIKSQPGSHIKS